MEKSHQNLKNKLEKLSELEGIFGICACENNEKIYSKCPSEKGLKDVEDVNDPLCGLCFNLDSLIKELKISLKDSVVQFSENFKIILLSKKEDNYDYRLCFLTSRYMDVILIRRYID